MPFRGLKLVGPRNHALDGVHIHKGIRQFLGLYSPLKGTGSISCGLRCKRDHSTVNNSMQEKGSFHTLSWLHLAVVTLNYPSRVKFAP